MVKQVSFFENIQTRAWAEAALIVGSLNGELDLTPRGLLSEMSYEARRFVLRLACGSDERPEETFWQTLHQRNILSRMPDTGELGLGGSGMYLVDRFLEEWEAPIKE